MARNILAVDDDPFMLKVLEKYLVPEGLKVMCASTGEGALEKIALGGIDLVILDLHLPHMDGFEVCRRIKNRDETKHLPVIMLTAAYADSAHEKQGYEAGADAYMAKPFFRRALVHIVKSLTTIQRQQKT